MDAFTTPINDEASNRANGRRLLGNYVKGRNTMHQNFNSFPPEPQLTIAPSEKHLEDWIIANPKGFGSNWESGELPEHCYPENSFITPSNRYVTPFFESLISRQLLLPHGRSDLIMYGLDHISVVELKKGIINYDAIGQCKRYMYDLEEVYSGVMSDAINNHQMQYVYTPGYNMFYGTRAGDTAEIQGMVIGHGMQDRNIPIVAKSCGIRVVTYEYKHGQYVFEEHCEPMHIAKTFEDQYPYNKTRLAKAMRLIMLHHSETETRMKGGQS
jgi:hypothetical protein